MRNGPEVLEIADVSEITSVTDVRAGGLRHAKRLLRLAFEVKAFAGGGLLTNTLLRVTGEGVLGGAVLLAGAATTTVKIYDIADISQTAKDWTQILAILKATAGNLDRTLSTVRRARNGIALTTDQADATVVVFYK